MGMHRTDTIELEALHWSKTADAELPYEAKLGGRSFRLRINDFPEEPYFTVMEGERELLDIAGWSEGWPSCWTRDEP